MSAMHTSSNLHEKIVFEDDLPPIDEPEVLVDNGDSETEELPPVRPEPPKPKVGPTPPPPPPPAPASRPKQGKDANGDYVFGKDEIREEIKRDIIVGDKEYQEAAHGSVLLQEKFIKGKDKAVEDHDYYKKGYVGQQKDEFGDERAKNYELDRKADMLGRKLADDYEHKKIAIGPIGPRKALDNKEKKKKAKVIESLGSQKYPERLATPAGNTNFILRKSPSKFNLCALS